MTADLKPLCPIPGCPRRLGVGMVMCQQHWRLVPHPLRRDFWTAWSVWREGVVGDAVMRRSLQRCIEAVLAA